MKRTPFFLFFILFLLVACHFQKRESTSLFNGTVFLESSDVPLIHLQGKEIVGDSLLNLPFWRFRTRIFLQDNILTLIRSEWWCGSTEIRHYSFPDVQLIKSEEISYYLSHPFVIPARDSTLLYYLFDCRSSRSAHIENWFTIDLSGKLTRLDSGTLLMPLTADRRATWVTSITHIGGNDFIYQEESVIVRASLTEKDTFADTLFHIPLSPYWGELLVNPAKNRMVFAHHHFHLFHIVDLETNAVKTVDFKNGVHYFEYELAYNWEFNPNPSYYVNAFAGENYFYLLFWGHTYHAFVEHATRGWREVGERRSSNFEKTDEYAQNIPNIVEKFDWNGNFVARYLLEGNPTRAWRDEQGHFWVDERNRQFFILAVDYQEFGGGHHTLGRSGTYRLALMVYSFCKEQKEKNRID